jgi:hypothetical protein
MAAPAQTWLLLLYSLSAKQNAARVKLWRKLKKAGALPLKTSAYVLPDTPSHYEKFQWLATQVRSDGGEATLIKVTEIEGLKNEEIVRQFQALVAKEYDELLPHLSQLIDANKKERQDSFDAGLDKLKARFEEIQEVDFFDSPRAHDVRMMLRRVEGRRGGTKAAPVLSKTRYQGKTWVTRFRPGIDRAASGWLIRRFIDPKARFVFANTPAEAPGAVAFDMFEAEFTHQGEDCTFETLVKRFGLDDPRLSHIAEMVHDADLEDGKFHRNECLGLDRVLKGWAKMGLTDLQLLEKGGECFEGLYRNLEK